MSRYWKRRVIVATMTVAAAATSVKTTTAAGHGHRSPPHGPIYRTLDALAGGIEHVIDAASSMRRKAVRCDDQACDDGCDALTMEAYGDHDLMPYETSPSPHMAPMPLQAVVTPSPIRGLPVPQPIMPRVMTQSPAGDDEWFDGGAMSDVSPETPVRTKVPSAKRSPSETYDSLPDPFVDDPQTRRTTKPSYRSAGRRQATR